MSTTTTNLGLVKPELLDVADITAMNPNWDILDNKLKEHEDAINDQTDLTNAFEAHKSSGLHMRGWNPISSIDDDTPAYWRNIGNGCWLIDYENVFIGQPARWGFFINMTQGEEVAQTFIVQASGETYRRNANGLGWYGKDWEQGTWTKVYDERNQPHTYGTADMTAGESPLETGKLYFVYE